MRRFTRPVPVRVGVKMPLQFRFQNLLYYHLGNPVRNRWNPQRSDSSALFGDFNSLDRWRPVTPRRHPIPQLVEVVPHILLEILQRLAVHASPALVGLHSLVRFPHLTFGDRKRLRLGHGSPPDSGCSPDPSRLERPLRSDSVTEPSPLLQATPSLCAASVLFHSRFCRLRFSLLISTTGSQVPHKSPDCVLAAFMPDADRAVNRLPPALSRGRDLAPVLTSSKEPFRHVISGLLTFDSAIHT